MVNGSHSSGEISVRTINFDPREEFLEKQREQPEQLFLHVGLDNLASPDGIIAKSQRLAAKAFGSEHCWFLVNGTSVGLQVGRKIISIFSKM